PEALEMRNWGVARSRAAPACVARAMASLAAMLLMLPGASVWTTANADVPALCRPTVGATRECSALAWSPWTYDHNTCFVHTNRTTEGAALQDEITTDYHSVCNVATTRNGWLTTPRAVGTCGNVTTNPQYQSGVEKFNYSNYTFTYNFCNTGQFFSKSNDAVSRGRTPMCSPGLLQAVGYCYFDSNKVDRQKNLGPACPSCGNPITQGISNKFQRETDYRGSGSFPLSFERYYNSQLRLTDGERGWYGMDSYGTTFGGSAAASLATADSEPRYALIGLDAIGANWRHSYQRMIHYEVNTVIQSAIAYRPDGRVITFNLFSGQFVPAADIADRLQQLPDGSWKFTSGQSEEVETYSPSGKLLSIQSRAGETQSLAYDSCGRVSTVTDAFGHVLTISYVSGCGAPNTAQRIASVETPAGNIYYYSYDANGNLASVTYPDSVTRIYQYSNATYTHALTGLIDEAGQTYASWTYDSDGRATTSQHTGGADAVSLSYNTGCVSCAAFPITSADVTDAFGTLRTYTYAPKLGVNKVASVVQPAANGVGTKTATFTYDVNGNTTAQKNFDNRETRYVYDLARNLETSRTEAYGTPKARTITTTWHATFRLPTQIDEPNRRTTFTHDGNGNVLTRTVTDLTVTPNVSRSWTYTYNGFGQVLTADGPRTDVLDVTTYT
ncbi:MAG: DUF6531 domain-containing protein, partial [Pyrinomonadaceae bacterium]